MYTCWTVGNRANIQNKWKKAALVGILHILFCIIYEITGINSGWFTWGTEISALQTRVFGMPIMAVAFHYAFGFCLSLNIDLFRSNTFFKRYLYGFILIPLMALLFDIPTTLFELIGISRIPVVLSIFLLSILFVFSAEKSTTQNLSNDYIIFIIPLTFTLYILYKNMTSKNPMEKFRQFVYVDSFIALITFFVLCTRKSQKITKSV